MTKNKERIPVLKYVWQMIKYRPWLYLVNCILWMIIHVFPLIPGLITKKFFDSLEASGKINGEITGLMVLIIVVALVRSIIIRIGGELDAVHRFNMSALLRHNLLQCIINNTSSGKQSSLGETMNCFRDDIGQIEATISYTLDLLGEGAFAIGALVILLSINAKITLLVFAPLVIVMGLAKKTMKYIEKYRSAARESTGDVSGAIGEIFSGIQAIKVSGNKKYIIDNLNTLNKGRHKSMVRDKIFTSMMNGIYDNTVNIGTGFILLLAGKYMVAGSFSVGDFSLFVYYLTFVADFAGFFGEVIARYQQGGVAFKRMFMLLGSNSEEKLLEHNSLHFRGELPKPLMRNDYKPLKELKIEDLTYMYNDTNGIKNINLTVNKGEFVVITGRIGSGKTTLVKTILGLLPKNKGKIYWNNNEVKDNSEFFTPPVSTYTSQNPNLFSDTLKNNIFLGLEENEDNLNETIYSAVLEKDIENFNHGVETIVGSKGVKLSGGQRQRVALARMFARKSQLYFLDDISSALDIETEIKLWDRMFNKNDITAIVVSNRHVALKKADKIVIMKDGRIEGEGTLDQLLDDCDEMRQIWGMKDENEKFSV